MRDLWKEGDLQIGEHPYKWSEASNACSVPIKRWRRSLEWLWVPTLNLYLETNKIQVLLRTWSWHVVNEDDDRKTRINSSGSICKAAFPSDNRQEIPINISAHLQTLRRPFSTTTAGSDIHPSPPLSYTTLWGSFHVPACPPAHMSALPLSYTRAAHPSLSFASYVCFLFHFSKWNW